MRTQLQGDLRGTFNIAFEIGEEGIEGEGTFRLSRRLLNSRNRTWFIYSGWSGEVNFKFAVYSRVLPPLFAQSNQLFAGNSIFRSNHFHARILQNYLSHTCE